MKTHTLRRTTRPKHLLKERTPRRMGGTKQGSATTRTFIEPKLVLESLSQCPLERSVAEYLLGVQKLEGGKYPNSANIAKALKVAERRVVEAAQRVRKVQYGSILSMFQPGSNARRIAERLLGATGNPFHLPTDMTALSVEFGTTIDRIREVKTEIDRLIYSRSRET